MDTPLPVHSVKPADTRFERSLGRIRRADSDRAQAEKDDATTRLDALAKDESDALAEIRAVLDRVAERRGISRRDVTYAFTGYAPNMLSDLLFDKRQSIKAEIEACDREI